MTFESLTQSLKSINEQNKNNSVSKLIDIAKKFNTLCIKTFSEDIDLSKGDSKDFMKIMEFLSIIADKNSPSMVEAGNETIWFTLSKVALELLMFNESNIFADATLKFNEKNKMAWFYKGKYYVKEKKHPEAEKAFEKAKDIDPDFYFAWFQIASMYEKIDLDIAEKKYLEIVEKFPRSMSGWKRLEEIGSKLAHFEVAIRAQKISFELSNDPDRKM